MWKLFLTILILLSFIFEPLFGLTLLLLVVIAVSSLNDIKTSVFICFICGLLSDVGFGRPFGLTILYFLIVSFIITIYKRRFKEESLPFLFFSSFIFVNFYLLLYKGGGYVFLLPSVIGALLVLPITVVMYNIKPRSKGIRNN